MKRFSLFLKMLLVLLVGWGAPCAFIQAQVSIDAIGEALDLDALHNGTSTHVVISVAANDASDTQIGFVYYNGSTRFMIDNSTTTKDALKAKTDLNAYTFVLEKTSDGRLRVRENVNNGYIPYYSGNASGGFSSIGAGSDLAGYFYYTPVPTAVGTMDINPAYELRATKELGLAISKRTNEFQVGGSSVPASLQFFEYASLNKYEELQANFPLLYTEDDLNTLRSSVSEGAISSAIDAFLSSPNERLYAFSTTGRSTNPYYIYRMSQPVGDSYFATAPYATAASTAIFALEYAGGLGYRLRNVSSATDNYLGPTGSGRVKHTDAAGAAIYTFEYGGTSNVCSIKDVNNSATQSRLHEDGGHYLIGWGAYNPTNNGNAGSRWDISPAGRVTVQIVAPEEFEIAREYTQYFIGESVTVQAPVYDNYVSDAASVTAHHDETIVFTYTLRTYDVIYNYVDAETKTILRTDRVALHLGDDYPAVEAPDGYSALTQVEGTVQGDCTYTIVCLNLSSADHPDVVPEKPATVNLTYQLVSPEGVVWYTDAKGEVANGEAYPPLSIVLPAGVTASLPSGILNTMEPTLTVNVPCTTTFRLKYAATYDAIEQWYRMSIGDNPVCPLRYEVAETEYMSLSAASGTEDKYLFAFVGNPVVGFKIYNKVTEESMILSAPQPRTTNKNGGEDYVMMRSTAVAGTNGYNTAWDFTPYGDGYLLSRHGELYYVNNRDSRLAFWTANKDGGSRIRIINPDVILTNSNPDTHTRTPGKIYRIYNVLHPGHMIKEDADHRLVKTNEKKTGDLTQLWILDNAATDGAFTLRNADTGRFIVAPSGNNAQAVTQTAPSPLYFIEKSGNASSQYKPYYGIGGSATDTGNNWLNTNRNKTQIAGWSLGEDVGSGWVIEETEEVTVEQVKARVKANYPYAVLATDRYYRLVNKNYPARRMVENYTGDEKVRALEDDAVPNVNAQIWRVELSDEGTRCTFQNAFTGHYITDQPNQSQQFATTSNPDNAKKFLVVATGDAEWGAPQYAFCRDASDSKSLHCDGSRNVVSWRYTDNNADVSASFWNLEAVNMDDAKLAEIQAQYEAYKQLKQDISDLNNNISDINVALSTLFTDATCSELNETYRNLSDYRIGLAIDAMGLPAEIKEMAIRVKHQTWEADKDERYNDYVRKFRIADYEPYSDCTVWNGITRVGPFGCAVNPSGVTVKAGDVLYVYVGDEVKDNDAELRLEIVDDTNRSGTRSELLHKGLNTYMAPHKGEVFVFYNVKNPEKYVYAAKGHEADYPNITVHIEGGEATGMWDAHRGMTDEDWDYLAENMLTAKFLHIKGHNTVIHCVTNNVRTAKRLTDVMKIYDFIFMTQERLIGHDGQWDGRYKPVMCYRDGYSGNPNWGGGSVNVPGLGEGYLNFDGLMNERWVTYHEEAHGHQAPFNLAATTESSNNALAQMVNHEFGLSSRRGNGVKTLIDFKNNGWGWVDMLRGGEGNSRTEGFKYYGDCVWAQNHMFYQLYLYFHLAGNMPDFYPRLCDEMRRNGGLRKRGNASNPTLYYEDYLLFAEACAKVSQTDLYEFFETWGFFDYCENVKVGNDFTKGTAFRERDREDLGVRYVGDYGGYYLRMPMKGNEDDEKRLDDLRTYMKTRPKKAPNIMFIDDHIFERKVAADCFAATLDPTRVGQSVAYYAGTGRQGDIGDFVQYNGKNEANSLYYEIEEVEGQEGKTVMMMGEGLVGVKIYDADGRLKYIYNTYSFNVSDEVAAGLHDGTYTLVAALGDDTNLPLASPDATKYAIDVYSGSEDAVQHYLASGDVINPNVPYTTHGGCDVPALTGNAMMLLPDVTALSDIPESLTNTLGTTNVFVKADADDPSTWIAQSVCLTDKENFYLPDGNYAVSSLAYTRTNTQGLNSVCLPFATIPANYGSHVRAYVFEEIWDDEITFREVDEIPAGTFALVDCGSVDEWQIEGAADLIGSPVAGGTSIGSFQNVAIGEGNYKLTSAGDAFGVTTGNGKVTAFRGYLAPPSPQRSNLRLRLEEHQLSTSVESPAIIDHPVETYDLSGRRVLSFERGKTYIINGKKTTLQ